MTPLNRKTFLLVKQYFAAEERFTTKQLVEASGEEVSAERKRSFVKVLYDLYKLGILFRESVGRNTMCYYWTAESDQVFIADAPRMEKPFEPRVFDREHREWMQRVAQRKMDREFLREKFR